MAKTTTIEDFEDVVEDIRTRFPNLAPDDLFTLWFLRAYVTEDEVEAQKSIVGAANDKNIDAIAIDDKAQAVFLVQAKYRQTLGKVAEKSNDVTAFADVISHIATADETEFKAFVKKMNPLTEAKVTEARDRILNRNYKPWLYYVTLGTLSDAVREAAKQRVQAAKCRASIEIIDHKRAAILLRDYLDGVAPPIPALDLEMEASSAVKVNGIAQRYDIENEIESWVFSMRGDAVAQLYLHSGRRLFARNIRGFLGKNTPVNREMVKTLEGEPDRFFYYNNGITILCDEAKQESQKGKDILHVSNPQVINGQQTTRTLAHHPTIAANATVLVKVIRVSRQTDHDSRFDDLVTRIVAGTNWQNQIRASDLMTNDRIQVGIEREMRKLGYAYIRRRQTKGETSRTLGKKQRLVVTKEELAQSVAACEIDGRLSRGGREKLFGEKYYRLVFPNYDPLFYLPRYWAMREVRYASSGDKFRNEARWVVLQALWGALSGILKTDNQRRAFVEACAKDDRTVTSFLSDVILRLFATAKRYYAAKKGKGKAMLPPPTFFKGPHGSGKPFLRSIKDDAAVPKFIELRMQKIAKALQ